MIHDLEATAFRVPDAFGKRRGLRRTGAIEYDRERNARKFNHNYVGTEHLLLGLLREEEGVAAQVLMHLGLSLEAVRSEVLNLLGQMPG